jgi:hypothetical protein
VSAVPGDAPGFSLRRASLTERNAFLSVTILVGCFAVFGLIYGLEMDLGRWDREIRLVRSVSETSTRYLAVSHFLLAIAFMATSRRMRAARPWAGFVLMLAAGAVLCVGWDRLRGMDDYLARLLFFGYFIAHDFRDQVFFFYANGDAPPSARQKGVSDALYLLAFLPVAAVVSIFAFVRAAGSFGGASGPVALPDAVRWVFFLLPVPVALGFLHLRRLWKREGLGRPMDLVRTYRPLFIVFAVSFVVLFVGLVLTGHMYAIVVLHVTAWYVFSLRQLQKRPATAPAPRAFTWPWMRSTPLGFSVLHGGLTVLLVLAGAFWAYAFRNDEALRGFSYVLGRDAFPLWTIVHVTLSFRSR